MRRKKHAPWRALTALCLAAVCAQAAPPSKAGHPFLWKIEAEGRKPSWLFGTIHLQRPDVTALPPAVEQALAESDAVYTEIPADLASMVALMPKMLLPKGKSLDAMLGPALASGLDKEIKSIDPALSITPFLHLKPWAVAAMLLELEDQMKYSGTLALDMTLYQRAASAGKETGGIETPDEQFAVMDGFSEAEQVSMIKDTIRQLHDFQADGRSPSDYISGLYLAGDLDKLVTELNKIDAGGGDPALNAKFTDRLLYRRNAVMAGRIAKRLRAHPKTSYFFAVGAAHLQGDRGLVDALEKAGFQLTRVQ